MNHMESNQLFTNDQHGLRKERSCITQLIEVMENISITTTMQMLYTQIQHLSYSDRSRYLGLPSLQYRRLRSDMVETFRIINNIDKVKSNTIFPKNENTTRGHKHKIYKRQCRTNIRKYIFSQRVVDTWNSLPAKVIESNTVNGFKNQLNLHWKDLEIKFKPDIYKPEVTNEYDKSRRVAGANQPKFMTSTPGKTR